MNRERGIASAALLTEGAVRYRLRQTFTYDYDGPVRDLVHRLVVVPPAVHGDQVVRSGTVRVSDPDAEVAWHEDAFGNRHCVVRLARVPLRLELAVDVVVDRGVPGGSLLPRQPVSSALRLPSSLTVPDAALRSLALAQVVPGDELATADAFCALVRERIAYGFDQTDVGTTASEALAGGTGVCQDQAHVMLALCRSVGIAARYVSGHLVGQGGTHAWVEVLTASPAGADSGSSSGAVAFDPCHGRRADSRYVTVAVGRDYRDVPPTSGSYAGTARGRLSTERLLESEVLS